MRFLWAVVMLMVSGVAGAVEFREDRVAAMDAAVMRAESEGKIPGGVLWMERRGVSRVRAYGERSVFPEHEPMTVETVFDAASLTKVIATTSAVMKLVEQGKIDPEERVSRYLPEFRGAGKEEIRVRQLLTHTSGLRAGISTAGKWSGGAGAYEEICAEKLPNPPGGAYLYSDINFILLGLLIEKVTGEGEETFCEREIFAPLGMTKTRFLPLKSGGPEEIAPTEKQADGSVLRGVVHDPTSRKMGGVAGHAGLFLTAGDLAKFARMMLNGGELDGVRIFKKETVERMTAVQTPDWLPRRGFGWDIDSPYAGLRGDVFPIGGYGHTGWTGTSIWIDPFSETFVIFLSNRNHPSGGSVIRLQRELATLAAQAVADFNFAYVPGALPVDPNKTAIIPPPGVPVLNGIDVLKRDDFAQLKGLKIGLVTNQTGQDRERNPTIDLLRKADGVKLLALFSPEHGLRGALDQEKISNEKDQVSGLPIYSLYGERRSPAPEQLKDLDALVFDIQDIGCRFYTYISTMEKCLEQAGKSGVKFIVLDRVNPIGAAVEGPVLSEARSFIAAHEIPLRHGMTVGELAMLINAERKFGVDLAVVKCEGGSPFQWFDQTALPWIDPSPNMRSLNAAALYPGVGLLEFCNVSVGRGTGSPFELLGAPYMDDLALAAEMNRAGLAGVSFVPVRFTPHASVFAKKECRGVRIVLTNREIFHATDLGVALASALHRLYGKDFAVEKMLPLLGDRATLDGIVSGKSLPGIKAEWVTALKDFHERRKPFLLYPR